MTATIPANYYESAERRQWSREDIEQAVTASDERFSPFRYGLMQVLGSEGEADAYLARFGLTPEHWSEELVARSGVSVHPCFVGKSPDPMVPPATPVAT